jgi:SH3-like domain-containing protein
MNRCRCCLAVQVVTASLVSLALSYAKVQAMMCKSMLRAFERCSGRLCRFDTRKKSGAWIAIKLLLLLQLAS